MTPLANDTEPEPAGAVTAPVQFVLSPLGVATTSPDGKLSVKATPLNPTVVLGLVRVKVSDVDPSSGTVVAPNALVSSGGATTVTSADAPVPDPPWTDDTSEVVLLCKPDAMPVTSTENVQLLALVKVAPDSDTDPVPAPAVIVPPPHDPVSPLGSATASPDGNVSVKPTPVNDVEVLPLLTWNVN